MKNILKFCSCLILVFCFCSFGLAQNLPAIIEGEIVSNIPEGLAIEVKKDKQVLVGFNGITYVAVMDFKKMTDGVVAAAVLGGGAAAAGAATTSNDSAEKESTAKNAGLATIVGAGVVAGLRAAYNWLTIKEPQVVFIKASLDVTLNNINVVKNLPVGTRVRVTLE